MTYQNTNHPWCATTASSRIWTPTCRPPTEFTRDSAVMIWTDTQRRMLPPTGGVRITRRRGDMEQNTSKYLTGLSVLAPYTNLRM